MIVAGEADGLSMADPTIVSAVVSGWFSGCPTGAFGAEGPVVDWFNIGAFIDGANVVVSATSGTASDGTVEIPSVNGATGLALSVARSFGSASGFVKFMALSGEGVVVVVVIVVVAAVVANAVVIDGLSSTGAGVDLILPAGLVMLADNTGTIVEFRLGDADTRETFAANMGDEVVITIG